MPDGAAVVHFSSVVNWAFGVGCCWRFSSVREKTEMLIFAFVDADFDVFDVDAHPDFGKTGTSLGAEEDACPVSSEDVKP